IGMETGWPQSPNILPMLSLTAENTKPLDHLSSQAECQQRYLTVVESESVSCTGHRDSQEHNVSGIQQE
ncbi:hypothetical protein ACQP3L_40280, partial [Escherichia coli]